jgi:hypothetical protein
VEAYSKLNTPGVKDGVNKLWIDGRLEAEREHLDWRGSYAGHGINAVFLESYWNQGSPVDQTRWIDNFVISTKPIGPVVCPANPLLILAKGRGGEGAWEVEVGEGDGEGQVVWKSRGSLQGDRCTVNATAGEFVGALAGRSRLAGATRYRCRVRQKTGGVWSEWSGWHQCFETADETR